jgi:hypothetical protein
LMSASSLLRCTTSLAEARELRQATVILTDL